MAQKRLTKKLSLASINAHKTTIVDPAMIELIEQHTPSDHLYTAEHHSRSQSEEEPSQSRTTVGCENQRPEIKPESGIIAEPLLPVEGASKPQRKCPKSELGDTSTNSPKRVFDKSLDHFDTEKLLQYKEHGKTLAFIRSNRLRDSAIWSYEVDTDFEIAPGHEERAREFG